MTTIRTNNGDTWDSVAWRIWGKGVDQTQMAALYAANTAYAETAVFGGNVELIVPEVEETTPQTIPPWRR